MKRLVVVSLLLGIALTGCKKKPADKGTEPAPGKEMAAGTTMTAERPMEPAPRPRLRPAPKVKQYKPLADLIMATQKCEKPVFFKCAEGKALEKWTSDVWMNRIKLTEKERIRAWKTAATLVLHPDVKIRNFAAGVFQLDPFRLREKISKDPNIIHVKYVKNLLKALPTLETFRSGWLMSYIPNYAPAYGLLDECFKAADQCKNKKDIYARILKGFPKYSRLKHFDITKKFAKDTGKETLPWATAALSGLLEFTWNKKEAKEICYWLADLLPAKLDKEALKTHDYKYYLYRYVDSAKRCKVLDSEKHLAFNQKMQGILKMLKRVKFDSKDHKKEIAELKDHFAKTAKKLKKK